MTVFALLVLGLGVGDLVAVPGTRQLELTVPWACGVAAMVAAAVLLGFTTAAAWLAPIGAVILAVWLAAARLGSVAGLWTASIAAVVAILAGQHVERGAAPIAHWYAHLDVPALRGVPLDHAILVLAAVLFLVDSSNQVVRLVLRRVDSGVLAQETSLKGGRVIGPLERVFILAMAASGNYTAATAVMAAKGILRYPEIAKDDPEGERAEYVLIGSFVSWALAFAFVALL